MSERIGYKVYVDVAAEFTSGGILRPMWLIWEDGTRYEIDRVKKIERCASRRAGGTGIMYTCLVGGREIHLFYEENYRWFVEAR
ncbi:MAG: hypothetical protein IKO80_10250 [Lachnospiraceae bacterium]|nr:hypothetical protein [Lachnospiraceae bacterium]